MDTHGLSRQDRERINEWGHELDITAEIKTAWNNLKDFAKKYLKITWTHMLMRTYVK